MNKRIAHTSPKHDYFCAMESFEPEKNTSLIFSVRKGSDASFRTQVAHAIRGLETSFRHISFSCKMVGLSVSPFSQR